MITKYQEMGAIKAICTHITKIVRKHLMVDKEPLWMVNIAR